MVWSEQEASTEFTVRRNIGMLVESGRFQIINGAKGLRGIGFAIRDVSNTSGGDVLMQDWISYRIYL